MTYHSVDQVICGRMLTVENLATGSEDILSHGKLYV